MMQPQELLLLVLLLLKQQICPGPSLRTNGGETDRERRGCYNKTDHAGIEESKVRP
jgi:hypothetical protein